MFDTFAMQEAESIEKAKLALKAASDEFMKTIPAGSRMRVTREEKRNTKREYNKRPEVKAKRRAYDQRPHVKLKRWVKNHTPDVIQKRKEYSSRDDVKMRRYIVTQRRRQLAGDCVKLLSDSHLYTPDGHVYHVEHKRLIKTPKTGGKRVVVHKPKNGRKEWEEIPIEPESPLDAEMFDGNLHEKENSEVLELIKQYYERAHAGPKFNCGSSTSGGAGENPEDSESSDDESS